MSEQGLVRLFLDEGPPFFSLAPRRPRAEIRPFKASPGLSVRMRRGLRVLHPMPAAALLTALGIMAMHLVLDPLLLPPLSSPPHRFSLLGRGLHASSRHHMLKHGLNSLAFSLFFKPCRPGSRSPCETGPTKQRSSVTARSAR